MKSEQVQNTGHYSRQTFATKFSSEKHRTNNPCKVKNFNIMVHVKFKNFF